ncbi:hypothetical protein NQ315_013385 [Exocentrus adspersus]|uniref:Transposase Tc1-like domain-containing protein n=1 Tax=Exocentrus adspersus TaxID=1586481 RepID=A0AAV8VS54_9CUCU|nr:hypothetical protein NQ315_013385 [Exocentrus adspersus]
MYQIILVIYVIRIIKTIILVLAANIIGAGEAQPSLIPQPKRWQEEQRLQRPVRQGVGKVSNNEEDNALVEYIRQNPFQTAVKAREETLFPGSVITARRRLKQSGLRNCAAVSKTFLSNDHKQRRIQFANAFLNRGHEFWNNVIFSDEKTFQSCNSGRLRVYRPRNTRFEERYTLPNASSGRFSVNVWGWISVEGPGCYRQYNKFFRIILSSSM